MEKLGFVPNVFNTYSLRPQRLRNFMAMYNEIMLSGSGLSKLEREMVAVVVSSANRCYYCLVAHGAEVRRLSNDPELGEMMALNYRPTSATPTAPAWPRPASARKTSSTCPKRSRSTTCPTAWRTRST